jgi:hypothetical protein
MKALCFALIFNTLGNHEESALPPSHIQDLLKKRILFQLKQQSPDMPFYFDDPSCTVVGKYEYDGEAVRIISEDKSIDLHFAYSDILEGKKLELTQLSQSIETKQNILAATSGKSLLNEQENSNKETVFGNGSATGVKKWLPWVVGAAVLSLGGWAIYSAVDKSGSSGESARRRR